MAGQRNEYFGSVQIGVYKVEYFGQESWMLQFLFYIFESALLFEIVWKLC